MVEGEISSLEKLQKVLAVASMLESCQRERLISAEDREKALKILNDKTHKVLKELLESL